MHALSPFLLPPDYSRIKVVESFDELVTTHFGGEINALCWRRELQGDFREIVTSLGSGDDIATVDEPRLNSLALSDAGNAARDVLREDLRLLRAQDLSPSLDCIHRCPRDSSEGPIHTDVYSFHVDSATVPADTYLCSYTEAASEGLRNDQAIRHVDVPETRAALLKEFGGQDDDAFLEFLNEHYYDLHYAPLPRAQPFSFGLGNLWRIAIEYPGCPVPPCIHRAPTTLPGQPPRLLLIS